MNRYVVAERNRMVIRIVEPEQFIKPEVDERRPLALPADEPYCEHDDATFGVALAICLLLVVSFGSLIAFGLELALFGL